MKNTNIPFHFAGMGRQKQRESPVKGPYEYKKKDKSIYIYVYQ